MKLNITDERAAELLGKYFYVEARVGSENHRGECCRAVYGPSSGFNDRADELIRKLAADRATLLAEVERLRGERNEAYAVAFAAEEYHAGRIAQEQFFEVLKAKEQA